MAQGLVLDAKLAPPRMKQYLPRPRILRLLRDSLHYRLALLCAPAGAGKTTSLSEFAASTSATTVWYRLDRTDRDPSIFVGRLLRGLAARAGQSAAGEDSVLDGWNIHTVIPQLVRALSQAVEAVGGQLVALLDDYHKVGDVEAVNQLLAGIVEFAPPGLHLVVSSRSVPALPLARLRLSGDLLEITQDDLALDIDEVSAFLVAACGLQLTEEELQLVLTKTGGWIAGVSMLGQSLRSRDKREVMNFLRDFNGSTAVVYDYFAEEVFRQQTPRLQKFLISTSVLSDLHRDLVNPLLEITDAQDTLESLAANNVFLLPLDDQRDWYKYHPLFREFLRARADRTLSQRALAQLHSRAAAVYSSQKNWERAIGHLCASANFVDAASIVEQVGEEHIDRGHLDTVKHWLDSLPDLVKQERPWLLMMEGRIAQRQGNYKQATAALTRAQTLFAEQANSTGLARVAAERSLVSYRMGKYREAVDLLEWALGSAPDAETRVGLLGSLCINYRLLGEMERSKRFGDSALKILASDVELVSRPGLESRTLRVVAQTYLVGGELDHALSLVQRAMELCEKEQLCGLELGWTLCTLGVVRTVRGESELALRSFREADEHGASYVEPQRRRVSLWRGNVFTDLGDFARAEECYQLAGFPSVELSWLHIRQGQSGRAVAISRECLDRMAEEEPLQKASLLAVLGMAMGASSQGQGALEQLEQAAGLFASYGYIHHLVSLRLHIARLLAETGEADAAAQLLRQSLITAESRGFFHFYWWDAKLLAQPLKLVCHDVQVKRYVQRLVERHSAEADRRALAPLLSSEDGEPGGAATHLRDSDKGQIWRAALVLESCTDALTRASIERRLAAGQLTGGCVLRLRDKFGLTWREIEVFLAYYLDRRYSESDDRYTLRKRLADELCMTENTLKSHVKSIRRKLGLPPTADSLQVYRLVVD